MRIQSVELVARPGSPAYQERIYRARLETGDAVGLFQAHWTIYLPPDALVGLTVHDACRIHSEKMRSVEQGVR